MTEHDTRVVGRRVAQFVIDYVLVGLVAGGALALFLLADTHDDGGVDANATFWAIVAVYLAIAIGWTLWVWVWRPLRHGGQTYGMSLLDLRVRRIDGQPLAASTLVVRWLLLLVDVQLTGLVGLLFMLITERNQRLGDLAAGTVVTRA